MRVDLRLRLRALQLLQLRLRPLLAEGLLGFGAQRLVRLVLAMLPGKLLAPFGTPTSFSRPLVERPRRLARACLLTGMTKTPPRRASMLPASDRAILCVLPLARECWLSGMSMEPSWQSVEGSPVGHGGAHPWQGGCFFYNFQLLYSGTLALTDGFTIVLNSVCIA